MQAQGLRRQEPIQGIPDLRGQQSSNNSRTSATNQTFAKMMAQSKQQPSGVGGYTMHTINIQFIGCRGHGAVDDEFNGFIDDTQVSVMCCFLARVFWDEGRTHLLLLRGDSREASPLCCLPIPISSFMHSNLNYVSLISLRAICTY
jgi:hypothetical protein